ncbi:microtubule-associated proteins 1A/1B light chain 3C-like [Ischnura elegans]|uniref:microtubule-associated proteins 1A/1B light chain 3C-like n=1 Tax=Ischnura elegans TaxID=197161 RepID=UPI001ED882D3|nr:microtubule-associated proteins 1A/1B light chain 3C-like [Ischnura elegans]
MWPSERRRFVISWSSPVNAKLGAFICVRNHSKTMPNMESHTNGKCQNGKNNYRPYKMRKSFATRKEEVSAIRKKFPTKVPVIVERYERETSLPLLDRTKFLVPKEITMSQFVSIIRNRSEIKSNQAFYLLINNKSITSMSKTIAQIYSAYKEEDGFLYITYASQEAFG